MSALGNEPGQLWARLAHKSISIFFLPARSASGRFFMFSAAKASERARAQLPEPEMRSEGLWESLALGVAKQERKLRSGFFLK